MVNMHSYDIEQIWQRERIRKNGIGKVRKDGKGHERKSGFI